MPILRLTTEYDAANYFTVNWWVICEMWGYHSHVDGNQIPLWYADVSICK